MSAAARKRTPGLGDPVFTVHHCPRRLRMIVDPDSQLFGIAKLAQPAQANGAIVLQNNRVTSHSIDKPLASITDLPLSCNEPPACFARHGAEPNAMRHPADAPSGIAQSNCPSYYLGWT